MKLYNSLTKQVETFVPLQDNQINLYVCGMTVYDLCHIGHARVFVVYDAFVRFLRAQGLQVMFVRNITDIDDKIIKRAAENQESIEALTTRMIQFMHEDERALGLISPDVEPRATAYIPKMLEIIAALMEKDYAYVAGNGDVCYDVRKFKEYGKLSHRNLDELQAGARIEVEEGKRNPFDFVLWKLAKPSEPNWSSPWGAGRPGWHIECSAMASELLGQPFDIHGGGIDLKFPHHENEIAQSEAACDCHYVNTWMHVGHVQVDSEKMSKSLGNFLTIRDALAQYHSEVIRYFLLSAHYRSPLNFSKENMQNAQAALTRFYTTLRDVEVAAEHLKSEYSIKFIQALEDDFNTPAACAVLFDLTTEINRCREQGNFSRASVLANELKQLGNMLGILKENPNDFLKGHVSAADSSKIEALIVERNQARAAKDWARADAARDELVKMNIIIEDTPGGTIWRKK